MNYTLLMLVYFNNAHEKQYNVRIRKRKYGCRCWLNTVNNNKIQKYTLL